MKLRLRNGGSYPRFTIFEKVIMQVNSAAPRVQTKLGSLPALALILTTATLASLILCAKARGQEEVLAQFETVLDTPAFNFRQIVANRNSQIATIYTTESNGPYRVYQHDPNGTSSDFELPGTRLVDIELSNWGTLIADYAGSGTALLAAPFGEQPTEFFRAGSTNSRGSITDDGTIAFFARESNSHGLRDVYIRTPQQAPQLLPELNEDAVFGPELLDQSGRLAAIHNFDPSGFDSEIYRYTQNQGWENLTASRLPADVQVLSSVSGDRSVSPEGNFVFGGAVSQPDGTTSNEVFLWDDAEETIMSVFDANSESGDPFLSLFPLPITATFSDTNDLFLIAATLPGSFQGITEFRTLYRNSDGTTVDLENILPDGYSLTRDHQQYSLNYDGDLWFSATNDSTGLFRYFLLQDGSLRSVIDDTSLSLRLPVLTNSNELYAWLPTEGSLHSRLGRLTIAIPEPGCMTVGFAAIAGWLFPRRKRYLPTA